MPNGKYPCKVQRCPESFDTYQARGKHMRAAHKRLLNKKGGNGRKIKTKASNDQSDKKTQTSAILPVVPRYCWNCGAPHLKSATVEMAR